MDDLEQRQKIIDILKQGSVPKTQLKVSDGNLGDSFGRDQMNEEMKKIWFWIDDVVVAINEALEREDTSEFLDDIIDIRCRVGELVDIAEDYKEVADFRIVEGDEELTRYFFENKISTSGIDKMLENRDFLTISDIEEENPADDFLGLVGNFLHGIPRCDLFSEYQVDELVSVCEEAGDKLQEIYALYKKVGVLLPDEAQTEAAFYYDVMKGSLESVAKGTSAIVGQFGNLQALSKKILRKGSDRSSMEISNFKNGVNQLIGRLDNYIDVVGKADRTRDTKVKSSRKFQKLVRVLSTIDQSDIDIFFEEFFSVLNRYLRRIPSDEYMSASDTADLADVLEDIASFLEGIKK